MKLQASLALLGAVTLAFASEKPSPASEYIGCYSALSGAKNEGSFKFQSINYCVDVCNDADLSFAALRGDSCWCGDSTPVQTDLVSDDECDEPCSGYPVDMCGGTSQWSVYGIGAYPKPVTSSSAIQSETLSSASSTSSTVSSTSASSAATSTTTTTTSSAVSTSSQTTSEPTSTSSEHSSQSANANTSVSQTSSSVTPTSSTSNANRRYRVSFFF